MNPKKANLAIVLSLSLLLSGCAVNQSPGQMYRTASRSHEAAVKAATHLITTKVITNKSDIENILIGAREGDKLLDKIEADVIAGREFDVKWKLNQLNRIIGVIIQKTLEAKRKEDPADGTSNSNSTGNEDARLSVASVRSGEERVRAEAATLVGRDRVHHQGPQRRHDGARGGGEERGRRRAA